MVKTMDTHENHRQMNILHSALLILAMIALLALLGWSLFGFTGLTWMVVIGVVLLIAGQRASPQLVMRLYKARPLTRQEAPRLHQIAEELAKRADLEDVPELYYVPSRVLNAFAVGVDKNAAIGLTDGLIRSLNERELTAVLAHEMAHVWHNDMWVMGFADVISRITNMFSSMGKFMIFLNLPLILMGSGGFSWFGIIMLILAPFAVNLLQLALSRTREYDADAGAVALTNDPHGMANALQKLETAQGGLLRQIFMPGDRSPHPSMFRTHPHTKDRIDRLSELAGVEIQPIAAQSQPVQVRITPQQLARVLQMPRYRYTSGLYF